MKNKIAIIGGGPGGYTAALHAARNGAQVTIIEQESIGGVCLHHGCIPSKTFKHSADLLEQVKRAEQFGLADTGSPRLDISSLQKRKGNIINTQAKAISSMLTAAGIEQLSGSAKNIQPGTLVVSKNDGSSQDLAWDKLIIATGSNPQPIKAFPFNGRTILSSDDILAIHNLPKSLLIVGGGVIGCEFACIMRSFGVDVTIVEAMDRLLPLPGIDPECSKILQRQMKKMRITFRLNSTARSIDIKDDLAQISITSPGKNTEEILAEQVLVCIGRQANTSCLDLQKLGVKQDDHDWIFVNEKMQTNIKDVYAIGDVLGPQRVMLAHVAIKEGKVAASNCTGGNAKMDYSHIPNVIFSRPEIACVGLTEKEAITKGYETKSNTTLFRTCGKAHVIGEIDGMLKIIAEKESGRTLGVHIIGPNASDLIGEGVLAVHKGCTVREIANTIHAHPTLSEVIMETAEELA